MQVTYYQCASASVLLSASHRILLTSSIGGAPVLKVLHLPLYLYLYHHLHLFVYLLLYLHCPLSIQGSPPPQLPGEGNNQDSCLRHFTPTFSTGTTVLSALGPLHCAQCTDTMRTAVVHRCWQFTTIVHTIGSWRQIGSCIGQSVRFWDKLISVLLCLCISVQL